MTARKKTERRLRLDSFIVQPVLKWDDGDQLTPGPVVDPQAVTLVGLRDLLDNWPEKMAAIQSQLDAAD